MHMADALLSPAVGAGLWVATGVTLAWSARKVQADARDDMVPLMGVLGAFVFAAMMINFTIPGTGSSGHIGGGLALSILLGPHAAFLVMASVLTVQALFFADGGLLALGANIFNLGFCTCFVAYPLLYRPWMARAGANPSRARVALITVLAAVLGLQLGALGVVAQTQLSDISSLPLGTFLVLMQAIHLAIGLVEGFATAALILFVRQARPDLFAMPRQAPTLAPQRSRWPARLIAVLGGLALVTAGMGSWFASTRPDGLEWSIARTTGQTELPPAQSALHGKLSTLQKQSALFPDYTWIRNAQAAPTTGATTAGRPHEEAWPAVDAGTSLAGVIGGAATLAMVLCAGYLLRRRKASPTE